MYIHWLDQLDHEQDHLVGGKGSNLGRLMRSGIPVPPGFCISLQAYQDVAQHLDFSSKSQHLLTGLNPEDFQQLASISGSLQALFLTSESVQDAWQEIIGAYVELGQQVGNPNTTVAVRSSATAEDSPEHSFAGQHDSYLGVVGNQDLVEGVKKCWASLWNPQAIHYRHTRGIEHGQALMAVVIQQLIPATCAGVLFTANPVTGDRSEMLVNSSWGLGEAVVSGAVEPDTFVVDKTSGSEKDFSMGSKEMLIEAVYKRGTRESSVLPDLRNQRSLTDQQLAQLVEVARIIEDIYQTPQDIEWAYNSGNLYILQSRPITALKVSFRHTLKLS
ncbi:MAG: PEP/pyruvate-binding domain-containing protein [Dehalococcoidia bacterium]